MSHVFHPGHELIVRIHAPGLDDNDYVYVPKTGPSVNALYHDAEHPSRITLPVISDVTVGPPTEPCADDSMRCVYPTLENESR